MTDAGARRFPAIVTLLRAERGRYDPMGIQAERRDIPRVNFGKRSGCKLLISVTRGCVYVDALLLLCVRDAFKLLGHDLWTILRADF